jgi:hypothetical protein
MARVIDLTGSSPGRAPPPQRSKACAAPMQQQQQQQQKQQPPPESPDLMRFTDATSYGGDDWIWGLGEEEEDAADRGSGNDEFHTCATAGSSDCAQGSCSGGGDGAMSPLDDSMRPTKKHKAGGGGGGSAEEARAAAPQQLSSAPGPVAAAAAAIGDVEVPCGSSGWGGPSCDEECADEDGGACGAATDEIESLSQGDDEDEDEDDVDDAEGMDGRGMSLALGPLPCAFPPAGAAAAGTYQLLRRLGKVGVCVHAWGEFACASNLHAHTRFCGSACTQRTHHPCMSLAKTGRLRQRVLGQGRCARPRGLCLGVFRRGRGC